MYDLLSVEQRNLNGANPTQLRKQGWVPAVIYAKGVDSIPLQVRMSDFHKIQRHGVKVFEVEISGHGKELVSLDQTQKDPVTGRVIHISLHQLKKNEAVHVSVPVKLVGVAVGAKTGGVTRLLIDELTVSGLPHKIPETIEVNIESLELDGHINVSDVKLAGGLTFNESDLEKMLVNCHVPKIVPIETATEEAAVEEGAEVTEEATTEEVATEEKKAA